MSQVPFHFISSSWAFPSHKLSSFTKSPSLWGKVYDLWEGKGFGSLQGKGDENEVDEDFHLIHTLKNIPANVYGNLETIWGINEVVLGIR